MNDHRYPGLNLHGGPDDDGRLGVQVEAEAELSASFGRHVDKFGGMLDRLSEVIHSGELYARPITRRAATVAAAGVASLLDCGGPNVGRMWEVMALTVTGSDDSAVLAGTNVAFYVGNPNLPNLGDLVLPGSQGGAAVLVPANAQFSRRQVIVNHPQHAFFLVYGAAAAQSLVGIVAGWDRDVTELPVRA